MPRKIEGAGILCPKCGAVTTVVWVRRPGEKTSELQRQRACTNSECKERFITLERIV